MGHISNSQCKCWYQGILCDGLFSLGLIWRQQKSRRKVENSLVVQIAHAQVPSVLVHFLSGRSALGQKVGVFAARNRQLPPPSNLDKYFLKFIQIYIYQFRQIQCTQTEWIFAACNRQLPPPPRCLASIAQSVNVLRAENLDQTWSTWSNADNHTLSNLRAPNHPIPALICECIWIFSNVHFFFFFYKCFDARSKGVGMGGFLTYSLIS